MFIRQVKKQRSKDSKTFYQYTLAQTARLNGKVKQTSILYLGSDKLLEDKKNRGIVLHILKAKIFKDKSLFPLDPPANLYDLADGLYEKYCIKYGEENTPNPTTLPPARQLAEYHEVDVKSLEVAEVKSFGAEHLCKQVLDKLQLRDCLKAAGIKKDQINLALISIAARAIFASSEYKTAQILDQSSELKACYNYKKPIDHKHLYSAADLLYKHQESINEFLDKKINTMFDLNDKIFIFDISNTYFETTKRGNEIAAFGRSKDRKKSAPIAMFTGVINQQGFIKHSRTYPGNTAENATLDDVLDDLEKHSPPNSQKTVVIDAGLAGEDELLKIKTRGYKYVCVSRKRLKDYDIDPKKATVTKLTARGKKKVELTIFKADGFDDTWMLVKSEAKREKEQSIYTSIKQKYEQGLKDIQTSIGRKGGTKRIEKVWERIGRLKEKFKKVSAHYQIIVPEQKGKATGLSYTEKPVTKPVDDKREGKYFIRTNYEKIEEAQLWDIYNTIRKVEATFRCLKTDLNIRPIHHQEAHRVKSHIYLALLAYQLVNTIRYMLKLQEQEKEQKEKELNHDWNNIMRIMKTQTIQNVILPTSKKEIHLRQPSIPTWQARAIYKATGCVDTQKARRKFVVYH